MPTYEHQENNENQKRGVQQNPTDRISRAVNPMNTPIECEECGGTYFYTTYAEQFAGSGYGSVEFRSLSPSPMPIRICLCGHPLVPKQTAQGGSQVTLSNRQAFFNSASAAVDRRKKLRPDNLLKVVASQADFESLRSSMSDTQIKILGRIEELEDKLKMVETKTKAEQVLETTPEAPRITKKSGK